MTRTRAEWTLYGRRRMEQAKEAGLRDRAMQRLMEWLPGAMPRAMVVFVPKLNQPRAAPRSHLQVWR